MASEVEGEEKDLPTGDLFLRQGAAGTSNIDLIFVMVEYDNCSVGNLEHQKDPAVAEYEEGNDSNLIEHTNDKPEDHPHDKHCARYHTYLLKRERLMSCLEEHKIDEPRIFQAPKCSPSSLNSTEVVSDESLEEQAHQKLQQCKESVGFKPGDHKEKIGISVSFYSEWEVDDLQEATLGHEEEKLDRSQKALYEENTGELRRKSEKSHRVLERDLKLNCEIEKWKRKLDRKDELINNLQSELEKCQKELKETLSELGRMLVENDGKVREKRKQSIFDGTLKSSIVNASSTLSETAQLPEAAQLTQADEPSTSGAAMQTVEVQTLGNTEIQPAVPIIQEILPNDVVEPSVQGSTEESSNRESVSLTYMPGTSVEKSIYNNYKLLLLVISDMFLCSDIEKFKVWARDMYGVDLSSHVYEVFLELDCKGIISASDLTNLRLFFETISRIDLVHLIDCFLLGDYANLKRSVTSRKNNNPSRNTRTAGLGATSSIANPKRSLTLGRRGSARNFGTSQGVEVEESFTAKPTEVQNPQLRHSTLGNCRTQNIEQAFGTNINGAGLVVTDGVTHNNYVDRPPVSQSEAGGRQPSQSSFTQRREPEVRMGSNGNKLSKFAREGSSGNHNPSPQHSDDDDNDVEEGNWLCNHYKRRCHVKFACCDKYWPCHRCHNNKSNCGTKKLKSIHTKFVKCVKCGKEQEFGDGSQYCTQCHTKFASYFCAICKHLTGKDDKPYHCEKCGICRIHKHRSFHCDVCGVCLDVQLHDNHRCRKGSAHDECCICLEVDLAASLATNTPFTQTKLGLLNYPLPTEFEVIFTQCFRSQVKIVNKILKLYKSHTEI